MGKVQGEEEEEGEDINVYGCTTWYVDLADAKKLWAVCCCGGHVDKYKQVLSFPTYNPNSSVKTF